MAVCGGSRCAKRDRCKNYEGNYFKCHEGSGVREYIDWSQYGSGSLGIDKDGNTYSEEMWYCGDFSDGYPMFELCNNGKLDYGELRKEIHKILCDFLTHELPLQNNGEFDWEYLEHRTGDLLRLIRKQGGAV